MSATEVLGLLLVGQGVLLLVAIRVMRTFGIYAEMIVKTHKQNLVIRENLALQQNRETIEYILSNPTEREA